MQAPELTLAAAIRDTTCKRDVARHKAICNLAPALLVELGEGSPLWQAAPRHERGAEVTLALWNAAERSGDTAIRSQAAIGLGMLGDPTLLERIADWPQLPGDDDASRFQRECAVIAISFVGAAAAGQDEAVHKRALGMLQRALTSEAADVRFQAAVAVVEVGGADAEPDLLAALRREAHPEVRVNLVDALSRLDPISAPTVETLLGIVASEDEGAEALGFAAAMVLAGNGHAEAGPRLLDAVTDRGLRDQALEALAVLGCAAPDDAVARVDAIAKAFLTPGVTRVRAAYAMARLCAERAPAENPGLRLLEKLAWHPKPAVREAVVDARANLQKLATER